MGKGGAAAFLVYILIGAAALIIDANDAPFLFLGIYFGSFIVFIRYLTERGLRQQIWAGLAKAFLIGLICMIPFIGWIIAIVLLLKNIAEILQTCREMMPQAIASFIMVCLLVSRFLFDVSNPVILAALGLVYLFVAYRQCRHMQDASIEDALFRVSAFWLAPMIIGMLLMFIYIGLRNLFQTVSTTVTRTISSPQLVSAHMRGGVEVGPYMRTSSKTVSEVVTRVIPGSGIITTAVAGEAASQQAELTKDKP